MKNFSNRKGFTLVELLIVIVVIGVLSAMMMLSSTEAVSSAKASNIISNLRNIKTATLAWYTDNLEIVKYGDNTWQIQALLCNNTDDARTKLLSYLGSDSSSISLNNGNAGDPIKEGGYGVCDNGSDNKRNTWFVGYKFAKGETSIKEKVKSRASSIGLYFCGQTPNKNDDTVVWMKVLGDWEPTTKTTN